MIDPLHLQSFVHFARAGGGGSGGSSGGGGGGILLLGYVPMHLLGARFRRALKKSTVLFDTLQVAGWIITVVYMIVLVITLRGIGFVAAIGAPIGMAAGLYGLFGKLKQSKQTKAALTTAAAQDGAWDEAKLTAMASDVFMRYQQDWSNNNAEAMKAYMTPQYQHHAALMIYSLQLAGRQDLVQNPTISQAVVVDLHDASDNSQDRVVIGISASATDQLVDVQNNKKLFTDTNPFTELWRFQRSGDGWLLDGIQQTTASQWTHNPALEQFAAANGYYYSLDMGWLFLPSRGQLFSEGKFGTSDINNHVVGLYQNKLLVQLYTYVPNPQSGNKSYLIAQANLPRSYGDIVVRRKKGLHLFGIRGLKEVSTEWPDFNKRYEVFATSPEQATSLELLNPTYMEQLEALPFEVSIEVVDSVVYLYTPESKIVDPKHYEIMLTVLQRAFQEMRL